MVHREGKIGKISHQRKDHENSHEHQNTCAQQKHDIEIPQSAGSGSWHDMIVWFSWIFSICEICIGI